jgi:thymidylate synthase
MNHQIEFDSSLTNAKAAESLDELQSWVLSSLLAAGRAVEPRGLKTLEMLGVTCTLTKPRNRCISNPERRWSLPLAVGEFCWHASGSNEVQFIEYYAKRWREFSENGSTIRGSCYGHTIFGQSRSQRTQWQQIVELLRMDPESRRAVLNFREPTEDLVTVKDVPCANTMQFLIRDSKLHAIVSMRSNDAIWGLPYDVFLFTMFQEFLASELGVPLGTYTHTVGSLHLYERHFDLARRIISVPLVPTYAMPAMQEHGQLTTFLNLEERLRNGAHFGPELKSALHPYWQNLLAVLEWYCYAKDKGGYEKALDRIPLDSPYGTLLSNLAGAPTRNFGRYAKHTVA